MPIASTNTESVSPHGMCTGTPLDVSRSDIAEPPVVAFGGMILHHQVAKLVAGDRQHRNL
jgi:hypothetical protein